MIGSFGLYGGLMLTLLGVLSVIVPLRFLGIRTRPLGGAVALMGLAVVVVAAAWPARETRVATARSRLDAFVPAYQFHEVHAVRVQAPPGRVFQAIKGVRANEILLFKTLMSIRRFGRRGPESILDASERLPLLEVAIRTSFLLLADEPPREMVVGTIVHAPPVLPGGQLTPDVFRTLTRPGFAKAAMNFHVEPAGPGASRVVTETRVFATDPTTVCRFAVYWRLIHPGSAIIRIMWLRAIKARAEATS